MSTNKEKFLFISPSRLGPEFCTLSCKQDTMVSFDATPPFLNWATIMWFSYSVEHCFLYTDQKMCHGWERCLIVNNKPAKLALKCIEIHLKNFHIDNLRNFHQSRHHLSFYWSLKMKSKCLLDKIYQRLTCYLIPRTLSI